MSEIVHSVEVDKQWVAALNSRDCKNLIALLRLHPRLWLKTAHGERTVLHVAAMQGCVELASQVLFGPPEENGDRRVSPENAKVLLHARDGKCRADAFELSAIVGNKKVIQVLNTARQQGVLKESSPSTPSVINSSDASRHTDTKSTSLHSSLDDEISGLLNELPSSKVQSLQKKMKTDVDYNFEGQRKGLIFNFACKQAHSNVDFLRIMVTKFREKEIPLEKLFTQMDAQGRTPLHVAVDHCRGDELEGIRELLQLIPDECVNVRDAAGRTPLLRATSNGMSVEASDVVKVLADDERTDLNAEWPGKSGAAALHLAVLHGHGLSARFLLEVHRDDPKKCADMEKRMSRRIRVFKLPHCLEWTPLELAAVMGRHSVLVNLLSKSKQKAAAGDPRSIQALLLNRSNNLQHFETNHNFGGYSSLHFAVFASPPDQRSPSGKPFSAKAIDESFDRFLSFSDFASVYWLQKELTMAERNGSQKIGMPVPGYGGKKTCATLLLQAGVDIWPGKNFLQAAPSGSTAKDFQEHEAELAHDHDVHDFHVSKTVAHAPSMPDPGSDASDDDRIWWFDLVAKDTLEAKNNFNAAGNATAVVATLVATASFIGPLTPHLGDGSDASSPWTLDRVQMESLPIRVFMASNSLSFYLAIASIMLAIMPSLPMPQESLREELHRSQRTVALAISVLLLSMLGLLVSFTSCLIAVVPRHHYWSFTFYPAFVGGMFCSFVLFLFTLRLLRLVFNRNARIKSFYHFCGIL